MQIKLRWKWIIGFKVNFGEVSWFEISFWSLNLNSSINSKIKRKFNIFYQSRIFTHVAFSHQKKFLSPLNSRSHKFFKNVYFYVRGKLNQHFPTKTFFFCGKFFFCLQFFLSYFILMMNLTLRNIFNLICLV